MVSLEITPPARWRPGVLLRRASALGDRADAVDVIQRAGRIPSLAAARWLARRGHAPIWNLVTRGRSRSRVLAEIERAGEAGLDAALCLQGEGAGRPELRVREAVAELQRRLSAPLVGVSFDPYAPPERSLHWLRAKLDAGARFVQTQPIFTPDALDEVATTLARHHPGVALLPMLVPVLSLRAARRLEQRLGIRLPRAVLAQLRDGDTAAGWRLFEENLQALARHGGVAGATLMTFEMDPPAELRQRLRAVLDRLPAAREGARVCGQGRR